MPAATSNFLFHTYEGLSLVGKEFAKQEEKERKEKCNGPR